MARRHCRICRGLDDAADADPESLRALMSRFAALRDRLRVIPAEILLVGEQDSLDLARDRLAALPASPAVAAPGKLELPKPPVSATPGVAWITNTEVNFCAKAWPAVPEGHPDAPALIL